MIYKIHKSTYNTDSPKNQHILDRLVDREVYCCMTQEVEYMLKRASYDENNPFNELDIEDSLCRSDIYEWWAVSEWFGDKLKEEGCAVIKSWGKSYWGRGTTGQSISMDGCVLEIACKMEILEGMTYEWRI